MNKITKAISFPTFMTGISLVFILSACSDAKTSSNAPRSTENNGQITTDKDVKTTQNDAQSEIRKKQLDADIRAREQRNKIGGDPQKRTESDLASEVRSKLEANIPNGKLTVIAKDSEVTIAGVVPKQEQLDKIKGLAMEIKGVKTVTVKAVVSP